MLQVCNMVFIVLQIRCIAKVLKPWLGIKVSDSVTVLGIILQVFVRADICCGSPIEFPYYSAKYKDVCINCGSLNELEINDETYPLCDACKRKGIKGTKRRCRQFKPKN